MNIKDKASKLRQLQNDPVFQEVIHGIREKQIAEFLNPEISKESLERAHDVIRAIDQIEIYFNTVYAEEAIFDKKEAKGQHRG